MNNATPDFLEGATQGASVWIRVHGMGSFKASPTLKAFVGAAMQHGCRRVLLDMQACTNMDSTFMGVLAGLALELRPHQGVVELLNLSERNRAALITLGLGTLVTLQAVVPADAPVPTMHRLTATADVANAAATILAAHENLITAAPENQPKFKDLVTQLKDEIQRNP